MVFPAAKIRFPRLRASSLLDRPRLEAQLSGALGTAQVVLLGAPAGFGKTALLARAIEALPAGWARVWLSLEAGDGLRQLLECLLAALEPYDPPWRVAPESLFDLANSVDAMPRLVATLANALDACETPHGVLALDDVHHLDGSEPALRFLDLLVQHLGPRWTLALAARRVPSLRLARLRGSGELAEFGEAQLRFSASESRALLTAAGFGAEAAQRLHDRTAGWPAGLRLALSGASADLEGGVDGANIDRAAFELLTTEVLDGLDPGLRRFLVDTSVLQELDPVRCAAVTGDAQPLRWLDAIQGHGLFAVVIDDTLPSLRLHDLFRDALRHRLRLERPQDECRLLLRAAASESDAPRRQAMLLAAGAYEQAAVALLDAAGGIASQRGGVEALRQLSQQFPPEVAAASAELHRVHGMVCWALWENRSAEHHLALADRLFAARGDELGACRARAHRAIVLVALGRLGEAGELVAALSGAAPADHETETVLALARCWHSMESCRFHDVAPAFAALVQLLERRLELARWFSTIPAPRQTSCRGMAPWLARWCEGALTVVGDEPLPLRSMAFINQGWCWLWQGRLADARRQLARADEEGQWTGQNLIVRSHGLALRSMLSALEGADDDALAMAARRLQDQPGSYGDWGLWQSLCMAARIAATCGDAVTLAERLRRLDAMRPVLSDVTPQRLHPLWGLRGMLASLLGRTDEAISAWSRGLEDEVSLDLLGQTNEVRVRLSLTYWRQGAHDAAAEVIRPALAEAQPGGALLARERLRELAGVPWNGLLSAAELSRLLDWAGCLGDLSASGGSGAWAPDAESDLGELSPREREVLELICRGAANKIIARELDLSPHTVKRHVANILTKLGVASRGEAAAWWNAQATTH